MKKIGIIDYFIDEWHSNTYLGLFEKASKELGVDYKVTYAYAEIEQPGKMLTDDWCAKNNVTRCYSIEELCEKSDNIFEQIRKPATIQRAPEQFRNALEINL